MSERFLLYGAYGYTGTLLAEEAVRRGHRPLLAGRDEARLAALADRLGLEHVAVDLTDPAALARVVASVPLVLHAAGPFVHTSKPMVEACLAGGVHYVDITGELEVFRSTFARHDEALARGVTLLSGAGFDVVPTDCLSAYVSKHAPGATHLEIDLSASIQASGGTIASVLESFPRGGLVRRGGELVSLPLGTGARKVAFADRERVTMPIPWGDLETAYRSTGIPNIVTRLALSRSMGEALLFAAPLFQLGFTAAGGALSLPLVRRTAKRFVGRGAGPTEAQRLRRRCRLRAYVHSEGGPHAEAFLETPDGYTFTAYAGIRAAERLLTQPGLGATTPALAFGEDFVLELPDTHRTDGRGIAPAQDQEARSVGAGPEEPAPSP